MTLMKYYYGVVGTKYKNETNVYCSEKYSWYLNKLVRLVMFLHKKWQQDCYINLLGPIV